MIASHFLVPPDMVGIPAGTTGTFGLPTVAAESALAFDTLFNLLMTAGIVGAVAVAFTVRRFIRRGRGTTHSSTESGDPQLQLWWTVVPALFLGVVFVWGASAFVHGSAVAGDALDVRVTAQAASWRIDYPAYPLAPSREPIDGCAAKADAADPSACALLGDAAACGADASCAWGKVDLPVLVVAKNTPVRLLLTAEGEDHILHIPAFRQQKRATPGRYTAMTFVPTVVGDFPLVESPGAGAAAGMIGKVSVVERADFVARVKQTTQPAIDDMTPEQYGQLLYAELGCSACHSLDGSRLVGPSLKGVWDKSEKLADGSSATVDLAYFKESLLDPNAKVVDGFPAAMTPFTGRVDDRGIEALAAYIQTIK